MRTRRDRDKIEEPRHLPAELNVVQGARPAPPPPAPTAGIPNSALADVAAGGEEEYDDESDSSQSLAAMMSARTAPHFSPLPPAPHHQISMKNYDFSDVDPRKNEEFSHFADCLKMYNLMGGGPEQELALTEAAYRYLLKHGADPGEQTLRYNNMVENTLYQLTMKGGTAQRADENINRLMAIAVGDSEDKATRSDYQRRGRETLARIKSLYQPGSRHSLTLQMIAADVMSQQQHTTQYTVGKSSNAKMSYCRPDPARGNSPIHYAVSGRVNFLPNDNLGTNLHEFTHVANSMSYDNTGMFLTFEPGSPDKDVVDEMYRRKERLNTLNALAVSGPQEPEFQIDDNQSLPTFVDSRTKYGGAWKTLSQYLNGERTRILKSARDDSAQAGGFLMTDASACKHLEYDCDNYMKFNKIVERISEPLQRSDDIHKLTNEVERLQNAEEQQSFLAKLKQRFQGTPSELSVNLIRLEQLRHDNPDMDTPEKLNEFDQKYMATLSPDTMVEYDSVINQMLAQYEDANGNPDTDFYRTLKAAALENHARRRIAALKKQLHPHQ